MHIRKTLSGWMTLAVFAVGGVMVAADPAFAKTDMDQLTIGGEADPVRDPEQHKLE